jgi:hypothetical protein
VCFVVKAEAARLLGKGAREVSAAGCAAAQGARGAWLILRLR